MNIYTKQSQWEKPTSPIYPPGENDHAAPSGPPPTYNAGDSNPITSEKTGLGSNNPYASATPGVGGGASSSHNTTEEDERYARQLQAEEDARARAQPGGFGASNEYYGAAGPTQGQQQYGQQPPQQYAQQDPYTGQYGQTGQAYSDEKGKRKSGTVGKLLSKLTSSSGSRPHGHAPTHGLPGYGQVMVGQPTMGRPMYGPPGRRPGGGLGAGGGMAMGAVGGLGAGMLLAHGMDGGKQTPMKLEAARFRLTLVQVMMADMEVWFLDRFCIPDWLLTVLLGDDGGGDGGDFGGDGK